MGEALAGRVKAEAEASNLRSQVEGLRSEKSKLESEVSELSAKVASLEAGNWVYLGGGLFVGALVGLGLALAGRRTHASAAERARSGS